MSIDERKLKLLSAVVEHFIQTAQPVGSKTILLAYDFNVSPATIRNEMAILEEKGLIYQPHTSAGRVPTQNGYRLYVDELADFHSAEKLAQETLKKLMHSDQLHKAKQKVQEAVKLLSKATPNLAFATTPDSESTFYMGVSQILKQPEFMDAPLQASQVMEVIEDRMQFRHALEEMDISDQAKIFIGSENILYGIESCSLIVLRYQYQGYEGYLGILGPTRMPYTYNASLLEQVKTLLESHNL